jgi:predicted DNA-binding transcriptional regulator YafY
MPKNPNQKKKLYYLYKILHDHTDDSHGLTLPQIQEKLASFEIIADRKSLYDDIETLRELGYDVIMEKDGRSSLYFLGTKDFEIAELKLLVDAIQSSKFITVKKSRELIKKLTGLVSVYEASQLEREVVVQGRIKTMNESIYYVVDELHTAISRKRMIRFEYLKWDLNKELVQKRDKKYEVSPWALTWDDENYYMIAYDDAAGKLKHYRVDKMRKIEILDNHRHGEKEFNKYDLAEYSRMNFGMFGGERVKVKLRFKNDLVGVFIDRFGKDITIRPTDDPDWAEANVDVAMSNQFLGWVFSLGEGIKIVSPQEAVDKYISELSSIKDIYRDN